MSWAAGQKPEAVMIVSSTGQPVYYARTDGARANGMKIGLPASLPAGSFIAKLIYPATTVVHKLIKIQE